MILTTRVKKRTSIHVCGSIPSVLFVHPRNMDPLSQLAIAAGSETPLPSSDPAPEASIPLSDSSPSPTPSQAPLPSATRLGRRPKFTASDDLVLLREVSAARAHVAPNGATRERFDIAARRSNATKKLSCTVTWKAVQDRYKRLQQRYNTRDAIDQQMSGIGGEVGEMEELLSTMKEEKQ